MDSSLRRTKNHRKKLEAYNRNSYSGSSFEDKHGSTAVEVTNIHVAVVQKVRDVILRRRDVDQITAVGGHVFF